MNENYIQIIRKTLNDDIGKVAVSCQSNDGVSKILSITVSHFVIALLLFLSYIKNKINTTVR